MAKVSIYDYARRKKSNKGRSTLEVMPVGDITQVQDIMSSADINSGMSDMTGMSEAVELSDSYGILDDGWNEDELDYLISVLETCNALLYELQNTVRGAYSNCDTFEELSEYVVQLADELKGSVQ